MEKKKIYKLIIDETGDSGVSFVALVDEPAIELGWQVFKQLKEYKFEADKERQMVSGPLMVADLPIYRRDKERGEHFVMFDADTIEKIAMKFFRNGFQGNVNLMHEKKVQGVYMFESWIVNKASGKGVPKGFEDLPDGSWFGTFKVENKEVWDRFIKEGVFTGFSVEGLFGYAPTDESEADFIAQVEKILSDLG